MDHAALEELRAIIHDAEESAADPAATLALVLWRLKTVYRLATGTDPWPDSRT